jgi:hypothetical protein
MAPSEQQTIATIRERMARLGRPVDDLSDDEIHGRAIRLIGRERGALQAVVKALARPRGGAAGGAL